MPEDIEKDVVGDGVHVQIHVFSNAQDETQKMLQLHVYPLPQEVIQELSAHLDAAVGQFLKDKGIGDGTVVALLPPPGQVMQ